MNAALLADSQKAFNWRCALEQAKVDNAASFYADVPDLALTCGDLRCSGSHVIFVWTFTGHDTTSGNSLNIREWEEWEVGEDLKVVSSKGWFDAEVYALQAAGQ